ncbi:MAG: hypothetical protein ACREF0_12080, partial [Acetobacteraceae bacterium]
TGRGRISGGRDRGGTVREPINVSPAMSKGGVSGRMAPKPCPPGQEAAMRPEAPPPLPAGGGGIGLGWLSGRGRFE